MIGASHPHTDYSYYGYDNFSDVSGQHYIFSNQTGAARLYLCRGYDGTTCLDYSILQPDGSHKPYLAADEYGTWNFTPISSIVLCNGTSNCPS